MQSLLILMTEKRILEADEFRQIIQDSDELLVVCDEAKNIIKANREFFKALGLLGREEELIGKSLLHFVDEEAQEQIDIFGEEEPKKAFTLVYSANSQEKTEVSVMGTMTKVRAGFAFLLRNMTEEDKWKTQAIKALKEATEAKEALEREWMNAVGGRLRMDRLIIKRANNATEKLFGYKRNELEGKSILKSPFVTDEAKEVIRELLRENTFEKSFDMQFKHKNGINVWCRVALKRDETGSHISLQDVTEIVEKNTELKEANAQLEEAKAKLEKIASTDAMTGLFNRRKLDDELDKVLPECSEEYPISVLMLDIDHFKNVNDTYGHESGDICLKAVANIIGRTALDGAFVSRAGGEEFVVIYKGIDPKKVLGNAELIRNTIGELTLYLEGEEYKPTVSGGIATMVTSVSRKFIMQTADRALYHSKDSGRNQITYETFGGFPATSHE